MVIFALAKNMSYKASLTSKTESGPTWSNQPSTNLTKETQLSLGTDSVLLWNLGISRMYMKIQNETKYVCHVMAPNDRVGGTLHTETREERFDLL